MVICGWNATLEVPRYAPGLTKVKLTTVVKMNTLMMLSAHHGSLICLFIYLLIYYFIYFTVCLYIYSNGYWKGVAYSLFQTNLFLLKSYYMGTRVDQNDVAKKPKALILIK